MSTMWEIEENATCVEPPPDSLAFDDSVTEFSYDDTEAAMSAGVVLPEDAEGEL